MVITWTIRGPEAPERTLTQQRGIRVQTVRSVGPVEINVLFSTENLLENADGGCSISVYSLATGMLTRALLMTPPHSEGHRGRKALFN